MFDGERGKLVLACERSRFERLFQLRVPSENMVRDPGRGEVGSQSELKGQGHGRVAQVSLEKELGARSVVRLF